MKPSEYPTDGLSGRNRRLLHEWHLLDDLMNGRSDMSYRVARCNAVGLPVSYHVDYHLRSICGVEDIEHFGERNAVNPPLFAEGFQLQIDLPAGYPCVDAPAVFHFLTTDDSGHPIAHPWHPNIRYFGDFAGRVCLNMVDTYTDLAWGVERIGRYLRYELYHAVSEPPYPEDMQVAAWVVRQGEPNEWIFFDQA